MTAIPIARTYGFGQGAPVNVTPLGSRTWIYRGETVVVSYTDLTEGDILESVADRDEHMILLPDVMSQVRVASCGVSTFAKGPAIVIVPPGRSSCRAIRQSSVIRLFTTADITTAQASNAFLYSQHSASHARWPDPTDGFNLRVYEIEPPPEGPGSPSGSIYRSTGLMVKWIRPHIGRRDPRNLTPHLHKDYALASLVMKGSVIHHVRTPWGSDATLWQPDLHLEAAAPSVTFMPPGIIHSSEWTGEAENLVIDVFSPPRLDISRTEGWVINSAEYPLPHA
jgi:hypothetical protein